MVYMRKYIDEISKEELRVLSKQFKSSPFGQNPRSVQVLDIYDFDSTLFLSPMLSQNIWDASFINAITTENLLGPGWWRDKKSLTIQDDEHFWNESVVESARKSCDDPNIMTVLLTGRRYYPFHDKIEPMLRSKGLHFDLIGLRPDPDTDGPDHPTGLMFNAEPDIFETTMDFKTSFMINILYNVPTIEEVIMWDDRNSHICVFKPYLDDMVKRNVIKKGHLVCIKPLRPKYNPKWELNMIESIISGHNNAIQEYKENHRKVEPVVVIEHNQHMISSENTFGLVNVPFLTTLKISDDDSEHLKKLFEKVYKQEFSSDTKVKPWERINAEEPVYFGDQVLIGPYNNNNDDDNDSDNNNNNNNDKTIITKTYDIKCMARTKATFDGGMSLQVQVTPSINMVKNDDKNQNADDIDNNNNDNSSQEKKSIFTLPLWYRPSTFQNLLKLEDEWLPLDLDHQITLKGKLSFHHLLTVDTFERLGTDSTKFVTF